MVRAQCYRPLSPRSLECSPRPSTSPRLLDLTPPASTLSSAASEISEMPTTCSTDISYQSAAHAFNREIFSRCVQIVEAADKQGHIEIQMITLAHHSYIAMVNEADKTEDALKLATWWNKFLEGVECGRPNAEVLEVLEMRTTALQSLIELDDVNRDALVQKLIDILVRSYKISCVVNRHFHSRTLRRLEKIAEWLEEYEHGDNSDVTNIETLLRTGIDEAHVDRHRYETETRMTTRERRDPNYVMCCEILRILARRTEPTTASYEVTEVHTTSSLPNSKDWCPSPEASQNEEAISPTEDIVPATPPATAASSSVSVVTAPVPVQQPQPCIQYPVYLQPQAPPTPVTPTVVAHPRGSPTNVYNSHMASVHSAPYFSTPDGHGVPYQQTFYYNNTPMAAAGDAANMQMMYGNGAPPGATPLYGATEYTPPPNQQHPHDSPPIAQGLFTPSPHHGSTPQGGRFVRAAPRAVMSLNGQFQSMRVSNEHPKNRG
nr:Protein Y41C4A.12, isoform b [Haemonchus contortus]